MSDTVISFGRARRRNRKRAQKEHFAAIVAEREAAYQAISVSLMSLSHRYSPPLLLQALLKYSLRCLFYYNGRDQFIMRVWLAVNLLKPQTRLIRGFIIGSAISAIVFYSLLLAGCVTSSSTVTRCDYHHAAVQPCDATIEPASDGSLWIQTDHVCARAYVCYNAAFTWCKNILIPDAKIFLGDSSSISVSLTPHSCYVYPKLHK